MEENKTTVEDVKVEETGNAVTQTEQKTEVKTFTQEEVNSMLKKEKQKAEKKYEGIDVAKYNEWVESQKTAEQRQAEKEAEYVEKDKRIVLLENKLKLKDANVSKEYEDFVLFTVSNMDGEFEDNLGQFLKDNPKYIKGQEVIEQKATGTPVKSISSSETDGVLAILKQKHPDMNL
jgi:hypothetical protein